MSWDKITELIEAKFPFKSSAMRELVESLPRISACPANVLILGESGTGKEIIAKLIHKLGPRAKRNFVAVNCAALPETLLESELFGHERGAFTGATASRRGLFQQAEGGTIFLDEIGDMPLQLQAKLLRVLQDKRVMPVGSSTPREVDFRLISATHQDLRARADEGKFRLDLYFRLNVVPLSLPALRDRKEDIPYLVDAFLTKFCAQYEMSKPEISEGVLVDLQKRYWEGNVRELENFIERLIITHNNLRKITLDHLPREGARYLEPTDQEFEVPKELMSLDEVVEQYITYVCKQVGFHQGRASNILGVSRRTIYRKLKAYGLAKMST